MLETMDTFWQSHSVPIFIGFLLSLLSLVGGVAWMLGSSVFEEMTAAWERRPKREPLTNKKQSPAVRASIGRLTSPRRYVRMEGLELLTEFNDASCVPALIRVIDMYPEDVPFLVDVVRLLAQLGDEHALPVLHRLSANRHYALTQAAREAIGAIEPKSVLLRAGCAPTPVPDTLLRASSPSVSVTDPNALLRAARSSSSGIEG